MFSSNVMPPELIEMNVRGHDSGFSGKGEELARYLARERGLDPVRSRSLCVLQRGRTLIAPEERKGGGESKNPQ